MWSGFIIGLGLVWIFIVVCFIVTSLYFISPQLVKHYISKLPEPCPPTPQSSPSCPPSPCPHPPQSPDTRPQVSPTP